MKKRLIGLILSLMVALGVLFAFAGCVNGNDANGKGFVEGEEVRSSLELPWKLYLIDSYSNVEVLDTDCVTITEYVLIANRKADMSNRDDLLDGVFFYRYIYDARIVGKVDLKYADHALYIYCHYDNEVSTINKYSPRNGVEVAEDGSFVYEFYVYTNSVIADFTPWRVAVGSYASYSITYTNIYDLRLSDEFPIEYTKRDSTFALPPLYERTEYEEIDGEYKYVTYVFDGWYNGDTLVTQIEQGSTGDIELTAHWKLTDETN